MEKKTNNSGPYYIQIKNHLLSLIKNGNAHDPIPSENALARQFNVSRGTAKQAIMDLVYEGVVYRKQGSGTFISSSKIHRTYDYLPSFTRDIKNSGSKAKTTSLYFGLAEPTDYMRTLFNLQPDEKVIRFKRFVSMNDTPYVVLSSYLNPTLYRSLELSDIDDSLYEALKEKYGKCPVKAKDTYSIVDISPKTADILKCSRNTSVCFSRRIAFLDDGTAAEYVESFIRSDKFYLSISIGNKGSIADLSIEGNVIP